VSLDGWLVPPLPSRFIKPKKKSGKMKGSEAIVGYSF